MKKSLGPNTLGQPTPVWVVGSYDANGKANMMTIAWGGICCSRPPCVTISLRKERHTYASIMERKAFTVNIPSQLHVQEADYVGMVSGAQADKFATTGFTAIKSDLVDAPYVQEFPVVLECRLLQTIDLGAHTQFIGEILDVKAEDSVLGPDGHIDTAKLKPMVYAPGSGQYYAVGELLGKAYSLGKAITG
ncbi:MAG: flavin reductase family protein [Humidesulfovibrio sp.]|uniref:flavin reductase family protein n=1 Tax=Humidesulfovibrio sp. TaxID=2910988 RepID=UPI002734AEFE|nr:flavin reductase family protein [Humidesulfovibrio sp.]MDP2848423.1 flavin reductase family protein [Humidesulfovibrio sp.]